MDDLTLLRTARHTTVPGTGVESRARRAMDSAIAASTATRTSRRSRPQLTRRSISGLAIGTGLAAGALVAVNVLGPAGGASPAAADTLAQAAFAAIRTSDPVLQPGQFRAITTVSLDTTFNTGPNDQFIAYQTHTTDTLFVPKDTADTWVWQRAARIPFRYFGAAARAQADADTRSGDNSTSAGITRGAGAQIYDAEYTPAALAKLPHDPQALLDEIYRQDGDAGQSRDGDALSTIADILRAGTTDARLRATLYRAAALIPDVTIVQKQANLDGRTGVALGRVEPSTGIRQDIIIDLTTGDVIGEREVTSHATSGLPANTVMESTAVSTTITNTAP